MFCFQNQPVEVTQPAALEHQEQLALGVGWQDVGEGRRALELRTVHLQLHPDTR